LVHSENRLRSLFFHVIRHNFLHDSSM
jgi:hypothetical protein